MLFLGGTSVLYAGRSDKAGTAAASELLIPVGASSIATGGANLAYISGVEAMFWNPAGAVFSNHKYDATFSHMNYLADIGVEYIGITMNVEDLATFGLSAKTLSIGAIPVTTADMPDGTGETTSPSFVTLSGMVSRMITDKISFGLVAHYIIEKMDRVSASGIAFTGGLQYHGLGGVDGLSMGVVVRNIGPSLQYSGDGLSYTGELDDILLPPGTYNVEAAANDLPSTIEFCLAYQTVITDVAKTTMSATFQNNNYSADEYKTGIEVLYLERFALRGGYTLSSEDEGTGYLFGSTFGVGVEAVIENIGFHFDYSYRSVRSFTPNHVITVSMGFN